MSLTNDLQASASAYVVASGTEGHSIDQIVDHLMAAYSVELDEEIGDKAKRQYVKTVVKNGLKKTEAMTDGQSRLPGFVVPETITVPIHEGKTIYVAFENATYEQAKAHVWMKEKNIFHAMEEKQKYVDLLETLTPEWIKNPELPAGEIMRRLGGEFPGLAS